MNYIVLDLEWNQSNTGQEKEVAAIPFEIIEMGAIKMDDSCVMISEFNELVKPVVYQEMNHITSKLIHMQMQELERGRPFAEVAQQFLEWCGEEFIFCTWGSLDLTELQRNLRFHGMEPMSDGPIAFLDVQKLFSIAYEDRKIRRNLEYAIDYLEIEKDIPFHRAFSDAYYAAKVLSVIMKKDREILKNVSYDVFQPPKNRDSEVKVQFDTYMKYISRCFPDKQAAFGDKEVSSSKCYLCHRNLRKRIRWFSMNGKQYYCVAYCEKHGFLKGKIRFRKTDDGEIYVIKTTKFIDKEQMEAIAERKNRVRELRKRRKHKQNTPVE
ncbi:MAG: exonuclease domain-containing protein [Lachnospiraceae bacterium]|nr:exonuclease domain-containing protein [Lachnospiraceae bacterium]